MKQDEIAQLLPGVFQRTLQANKPLAAILEVMEQLHAPAEEVLANSDTFFDPYRAPGNFLPFLATWVDLASLIGVRGSANALTASVFPSGLGRLRALVATAAYHAMWRGTATGLIHFLETATGIPGFQIDEGSADPGQPSKPFHLTILAPPESAQYQGLLQRIIEAEKPAYVTYDLRFQRVTSGGIN
jgi:phage tail-like protein